jgi:hypothetical protein
MTEYTYNVRVYSGKARQNAMQMMTATRVTVRSLTRRVEGVGHKLYVDNFFSSPDYFMTCTQEASAVVECNQNHKHMLWGFDSKTLKLK